MLMATGCHYHIDKKRLQHKKNKTKFQLCKALLPEFNSRGSLVKHIHLFRPRIMESIRNSLDLGGAGTRSGCQNHAKVESLVLNSGQSLECWDVQ